MTNNIAKIRAALEYAKSCELGLHVKCNEALAALAELEKAAAEPVATIVGFDVESGLPVDIAWHADCSTFNSGDKLYAAPQFVAGGVDDAMCERVFDRAYGLQSECGEDTSAHEESNAWLTAWRSELGPALGLVEIREPGREDCIAITKEHGRLRSERAGQLVQASVSAGMMREGRDMFAAVSKWLKGEL